MISQEKLEKVYEGVIEKDGLTTKELNSYGLNSNDLKRLVDDGILQRVKRGSYQLKDINGLFHYGKKISATKSYSRSTKCFLKCLEIDPDHKGTNFQLFYRAIQDENYDDAFMYLDKFWDTDNKYYKKDIRFFLYLLNIVTEIPTRYKDQVFSISYDDIEVDVEDKRYSDIELHNEIRRLSISKRFFSALKLLKNKQKDIGTLTFQEIVIKTLLDEARIKQHESKNYVTSLIKDKKYKEAIEFLENDIKKKRSSTADIYILYLLKDLVMIKETKTIPEPSVFTTDKLFLAIKSKNYKLALDIIKKPKSNIDPNNNSILILLYEINNLINEILNQKSVVQKPTREEPVFDCIEFLNSKINEINKKGIVLLEPMDDNKRAAIHETVKYYKGIDSFDKI